MTLFEGDKLSVSVLKHLDRPQAPWSSLTRREGFPSLYITNARTLDGGEIGEIKGLLTDEVVARRARLNRVQFQNQEILGESANVGVVLDARAKGESQGWIGDVIEASRVVPALLAEGKNVTIFASHPDMFIGNADPRVAVVPIPRSLEPALLHPWNQAILQFIYGRADAFVFPLNAHMPVIIKVDSNGAVTNTHTINSLKEAIRPGSLWSGINVAKWSKHAVHQLQALQVYADLIGIGGAGQWTEFPPVYLYPGKKAQAVAKRNLNNGVSASPQGENILLVHPGSAIDNGKINSKSYPEQSWYEVLEKVSEAKPNLSLVVLKPKDPLQAALASRLTCYGREQRLSISEVPSDKDLVSGRWHLGTFIAYLQQMRQATIVGLDSMPAAHLGPALGMSSVVLGNLEYPPIFFGPTNNSQVVIPDKGYFTSGIKPADVVGAIAMAAQRKI